MLPTELVKKWCTYWRGEPSGFQGIVLHVPALARGD